LKRTSHAFTELEEAVSCKTRKNFAWHSLPRAKKFYGFFAGKNAQQQFDNEGQF
jgi:hypothetical protein